MAQISNDFDAETYARLAAFDGDWRDGWWHDDYLALVGRRLRLSECREVVDVGCGAGHWGLRLLPLCAEDAVMVGVDRERSFLSDARERAAQRGLGDRASYRHALGEALPLADNSVDLATCQTVLMHVTEARDVVAEMARVVRPGGVVLVAEPDNTVNAISMARRGLTLDEMLAALELQLYCAEGKRLSGHGDETVGGRLVTLFSAAGLAEVESWTNDRVSLLEPPYACAWQQLELAMMRDTPRLFEMLRDRQRGHFLLAGGTEDRFDMLWALQGAVHNRKMEAVAAGTFRRPGGFVHYLCAGRVSAPTA